MISINMLIVTLDTYISYSCTGFILIFDYACLSFIYVSLVILLLCFLVSLFDVVKGGDAKCTGELCEETSWLRDRYADMLDVRGSLVKSMSLTTKAFDYWFAIIKKGEYVN